VRGDVDVWMRKCGLRSPLSTSWMTRNLGRHLLGCAMDDVQRVSEPDPMAPFEIHFPLPFPYFHFSQKNKKINLKTFLTFCTFYITSTLFYYFLNKKLTTIQIFFSLFYINYFNFISHQSYFPIIQKKFLIGGEE
jgi:hypothetical protein